MENTKDILWKKIKNFIVEQKMFDGVKNVVAGVSGGPDSMCMLHVLCRLQKIYEFNLVVVHIHHGIRGKDADEDMLYVEKYCKEREISFRAYRYDVPRMAKEARLSGEEMGRKLRYDTFAKICDELEAGVIAVAHHSDDVSETFLMNLFRGTGVKGLSGIRPIRGNVIRPLLSLSRTDVMDYLQEYNIAYRVDASNLEDEYTRNKIRNQVLAYAREEINDRVSEHICQAAAQLNEISEYLDRQAATAFERVVLKEAGNCEIDIDVLMELDIVLRKMVVRKTLECLAGRLKDISAKHVMLVLELANGETGKQIQLPYNIICQKSYGRIRCCAECETEKKTSSGIYIEYMLEKEKESKKEIYVKDSDKIYLEVLENTEIVDEIQEKMYTKWLDYDILKGSLQIRNRENGDYIVVNDQGGKKKLKDYFIDLKIPREERDRILLVAKGQEVFWIIGYRISERCKITAQTNHVVELTFCSDVEKTDICRQK